MLVLFGGMPPFLSTPQSVCPIHSTQKYKKNLMCSNNFAYLIGQFQLDTFNLTFNGILELSTSPVNFLA